MSKLHEEFKLYERLWDSFVDLAEDAGSTVKTFGRKTYDLSNEDELRAWIEANVQFQMKRYPSRYATEPGKDPEFFDGESRAADLRGTIARNLINRLKKDGTVDSAILRKIEDETFEDRIAGYERSMLTYRVKEQRELEKAADAAIEAFLAALPEHRRNYALRNYRPEAKDYAREQIISFYTDLRFNNDYYIPDEPSGG